MPHGKAGLVPAPAAGAQAKFLRGDATWQTIASVNTKAYITTTWVSDTSWYRKYSDGWVEQGGRIQNSNNAGTQTFHIAFTTTNYTLVMSDGQGTGSSNDTGGGGDQTLSSNFTTTSFRYSKHSGNTVSWCAYGY